MPKKRHTAEEIIQHLRTVEIERGEGPSFDEAAWKIVQQYRQRYKADKIFK